MVCAGAGRSAVQRIGGEQVGFKDIVVGGTVGAASDASSPWLVAGALERPPFPAPAAWPAVPLIWGAGGGGGEVKMRKKIVGRAGQ